MRICNYAIWLCIIVVFPLVLVSRTSAFSPPPSGPLTPLYGINPPNGYQDHVFVNIPAAVPGTTVNVSVNACADLNNLDEFITVVAQGGKSFGQLFGVSSATGCGGSCDTAHLTMTAEEWNTARASIFGGVGGVLFQFTPSLSVTNICCSDTCATSGPGGTSECCPTQCSPIPCFVGVVSVSVSYTDAECNVDSDCDDGVLCNGAETCSGGFCQDEPDPCVGQLCCESIDTCHDTCCSDADCLTGDRCDVLNDECVDCLNDDDCPAGFFCDNKTCAVGTVCAADAACVPGSPAPCVDYACGGLDDVVLSTSSPGYSETGSGWISSGDPGCNNELFRAIDLATASAGASATWSTSLLDGGIYEVFVCFEATAARSTSVGYEVIAGGVPHSVNVDQTFTGEDPKVVSLGTFTFPVGPDSAVIRFNVDDVLDNPGTTLVIADTVRFLRRGVCAQSPAPNGGSCSDGVFCNGAETCLDGACIPSVNPCGFRETCNETEDVCMPDDCSVEAEPDGFCTPPSPIECTDYTCRDAATTTIATSAGSPAYVETDPGWQDTVGLGCNAEPYRALDYNGEAGTATWRTALASDEGGVYEVSACFFVSASRSEVVEYVVHAADGPVSVVISQYESVSPSEERTKSLGFFEFVGGQDAVVELHLDSITLAPPPATSTLVIADTVTFERLPGCEQDVSSNGAPCSDGVFCNGEETCSGGTCVSGAAPCIAGEVCDELFDECDPDCNGNGVDDNSDIFGGTSSDCNVTGIPDECEPTDNDCDANRVPDECQEDCDTNGVPDVCDDDDLDFGFLSPDFSPLEAGQLQSYSLPQLYPAVSDVLIFVDARGNLAGPDEYIELWLNDTFLARFFEQDAQDCPVGIDPGFRLLSADAFNSAWDADGAVFTLIPSSAVDPLPGCDTLVNMVVSFDGTVDCDDNSVFDACDIIDDASRDCDANGLLDECEIASWEADGDVDLSDFQQFQRCIGVASNDCLKAFDLRTPCGTIDLRDFMALAGDLSGPSALGGQTQAMGDGGGGGTAAMSVPIGGDGMMADSLPVGETAETPPAMPMVNLTLTVQPVGGGDELAELAANTTYELYYAADCDVIATHVVYAVARNALAGATAAGAPLAGDWSNAGNFMFTLATDDPPAQADGFSHGYYRFASMLNGFWGDTQAFAGGTGHLFTFTTGRAGELGFEVHLVGESDGVAMNLAGTLLMNVNAGE
jgi:hypothetical protein